MMMLLLFFSREIRTLRGRVLVAWLLRTLRLNTMQILTVLFDALRLHGPGHVCHLSL
jgi:hypothetical protein